MKSKILIILIMISVIVRLINIYEPISGMNTWRQADTAAMARNFVEYDFNILHPQIDWAGIPPAKVEAEFQLYTFITAIFYKLFGINELIPRILSILFSFLSMWFLYLLIKKYSDEKTALWSILLYSFLPFNILFSNQIQPEPMMLMSITGGIWFFVEWLESKKKIFFVSSMLLITIACLLKITSLHIGIFLFYLSWKKFNYKMFLKPQIILYALFVLLLTGAWYYYAHLIKQETGVTFGIWEYGEDKWGNWALVSSLNFWNSIIFNTIASKHLTWIGFPIFLYGFFMKRKEGDAFFDVWLLSAVIYLIIVAKGNYVHAYYQFPLILPMVYYMGKVFAKYMVPGNLKSLHSASLHLALILMFILSSIWVIQNLSKQNQKNDEAFLLALDIKKIVPTDAALVILNDGDPVGFYNSHRKGYNAYSDRIDSTFFIDVKSKGAKYFAMKRTDYDKMQANFLKLNFSSEDIILNNSNSVIFSLQNIRP
ncbi:MAG: glycosyltransferase family 39 protein [Ignavibacterium sp.]|jgi:4-amino-4-deoxy-L-arabinose transferase-like glycosyltransferase|nr:glycosyltransferase family 39 protein [Ignavibacterium sp.]